jgi:N4-gp56 family major capsid protein
MAQTIIGLGDAKSVKRWSGELAVDTAKKGYFSKKFLGTSQNSVIQQKTELESDAGEQISFDLSVQLRGKGITGDDRAEGKQENLRFYTDTVYIDQMRKPVSAGGKMTRKRTLHDLRKVAKDRASDWWAKYMDELMFVYLSGARGVNEDFIEDTSFAGFANNPIQAPDADHLMYGGSALSKGAVTNADKMSRTVIERAVVKARMMRAVNPDATSMQPVTIDGEEHFVCVMTEFQAYDLRVSAGTEWLDIQKAAAAAEGKNNPIFKGGLGMINNVILHSHEGVVRFSDYGVGVNLPASRALFMGRQAGVVAFGAAGGMRFDWHEEMLDFGNEPVISTSAIFGIKKSRFNGKDFGVLSIDTYAANPNV